MSITGSDLHNSDRILDLLTTNFDGIYYIPFDNCFDLAGLTVYRDKYSFLDLVTCLFSEDSEKISSCSFDGFRLFSDDCNVLMEDTKMSFLTDVLKKEGLFYTFFRAFIGEVLHHFELKIVADIKDSNLNGITVAIIDNGAIERAKLRQEQNLRQNLDNAERAIMKSAAELRERTIALSISNAETIDLLGNLVEFRSQESGLHIKRVKLYTKVLAEQIMQDYPEYGLTSETVDNIVSASSLHDVGKIMIPDVILLKPGKLTPEEFAEMRRHCEYGLEVLRSAPKSWTSQYTKIALDICYCHHEKWNGSGYPRGLKGDQIPIAAQIVSVADCYDALSTKRVYKPAYSADESYNMIVSGKCGVFSDKILSSFEKCRSSFARIYANPARYSEKSTVQLSGEYKLKGLNILLVDDSDISLEINCDILENEGAIVTTAENGLEAIDKFKKYGPFDAIIMDIVMPEMNGIEASKAIRQLESGTGNRVPIIALTAEGTAQSALLEAGINASMAKPLVIAELTRILISCMHNSSMQLQKQLMETLKIANTDALTKVKSIAAYTDMLASLNSDIMQDSGLSFAIVMSDINNLKLTNDTYGHETGNLYIKNCCKLLSETFSGSPVYRIGGDEFAVILQGSDYDRRAELFESLHKKIDEAEKIEEYSDGKASLAIGMSEYNPLTDMDVQNVQDRADAYMYIDKRNRKEGF